jgi:uncharacterized protein YjbJ (UPF0337 family)
MKQGPRGHVQDNVANAKGKLKTKAAKKSNQRGLQGDEKIGGKLKETAGNAG